MDNRGFISPYTPNTDADRRRMLDAIGVGSVSELFLDVPANILDPNLDIPPPLSELELGRVIGGMARSNVVPGDHACFLGGGSYRHHIPAVVRQIASRSEFMTAYTPYQPEVSQGTLQAHYEFQSLVCQLTGMEISNSGMYDGATSLAEAALMAARVTGKQRVVSLESVSPYYLEVLKTFGDAPGLEIEVVPDGVSQMPEGSACLIVQQPTFYGRIVDLMALSALAHSAGALLIVVCDLMSLAMFKSPGDYDADIVVAEGQTMGVAPTFGGPYVGIFACKQKYSRQMPGRIVGKTTDADGHEGFVLTLQTREQHIRRERATSNICTSVGLIALIATVYMASLGKRGLRHVAESCYHKAHYAASKIADIPGYFSESEATFFREFVVECPIPPKVINKKLLEYRIIGGLDVSEYVPNGMLLCCTEVNSKEEIDLLVSALAEIGGTK